MWGLCISVVIIVKLLLYVPLFVHRSRNFTSSTTNLQSLGNGVRDNAVLFLNFLFYGLPRPKGLAMTGEGNDKVAKGDVRGLKVIAKRWILWYNWG